MDGIHIGKDRLQIERLAVLGHRRRCGHAGLGKPLAKARFLCYNKSRKALRLAGWNALFVTQNGRERKRAEGAEKTEVKDLHGRLESLKEEVSKLGTRVKEAADKSREWAKEHPAASVGMIAGLSAMVGFIVGFVFGRRRD